MKKSDEGNAFEHVVRNTTFEHVMLIGGLVVAGYALIRSYDFVWEAAIFPRFVATVTIIGCALLLVRNYVPAPFSAFLQESDAFTGMEAVIEDTADQEPGASPEPTRELDRPISGITFMSVALAGVAVVGYLIGLLWAILAFIFLFGRWFDLSLSATILLTLGGGLIVYAFQWLFNIPVIHGVLL